MPDATRTPLSELLKRLAAIESGYTIDIPEDWRQGRAIYGGLSAALCLAAIYSDTPTLPPLRSGQIAFIGPATSACVRIQLHTLRQGRSTTFIAADMYSGDREIVCRATFCFGAPRACSLSSTDSPSPNSTPPGEGESFFEDARGRFLGPAFARHFEARRAGAARPMSASPSPAFLAWIRHRDLVIEPASVALIALADALPPAAMASMTTAAPVSSMTWQFDMLTGRPTTEDGWWLCHSRADRIDQGYAGQTMAVWNTQNEPVIAARQSVAIFV